MVGDDSGDLNAGDDVGVADLNHAHRDVSVVDQQAVAGCTVAGQALERRSHQFLGAGNVADCDREGIPRLEFLGPVLEGLQPNLGSLKVNEDCNGAARCRGRLPNSRDDSLMLLGFSVRPVDARNIHSGINERLELLGGIGGRSNGADNFSSTHSIDSSAQTSNARGGAPTGRRDDSHEPSDSGTFDFHEWPTCARLLAVLLLPGTVRGGLSLLVHAVLLAVFVLLIPLPRGCLDATRPTQAPGNNEEHSPDSEDEERGPHVQAQAAKRVGIVNA